MFVVMVATECAPVAQAGGLGDVVHGLSRELELRGNAVEIVLPKYDCLRYDRIYGLSVAYENLWAPWYSGAIRCTVWFGFVDGLKCFFIEPHSADRFFDRGHLYGSHDDVSRFAFFSKATLEFMLKSNKRPEIIHCHDWQTALVPVLLYEIYDKIGMGRQRVCFTVHNFGHQGITDQSVLWATRLGDPARYFSYECLRDNFNPAKLNLMKGGIVYSNFVTTVSPRHAWEVSHSDQGRGLEHTLRVHSQKFGGVLNGIDYDTWNPEIDPWIPQRYGIHSIDDKYVNKRSLRERFMLRHDYKPIVAYIGRLDSQKGVDLVHHAIFYALERGAQFVLLGTSPDPAIGGHFWRLKHHLNDNPDVHLELQFNPELAHLVYAGSDLVVMPSMFEPCGIVQLIALKYGTVPIVRAVGGLADTVADRDYAPDPPERRTGYVFHQADHRGIESAMKRAIGLWHDYPQDFRHLMLNGMRADHSWARPGQDYLNIYDYIREK
ncbi:MAG TPA: glycogen synthase [Roseiarcus sp.]|nr:glycogen synthase [Roseiarcus sp.]